MATDLTRIGEKARKERQRRFSSLLHHVYDMDNLKGCYRKLGRGKAIGIDKITKEAYGVELESNLEKLQLELIRGGYKPGKIRQVEIPKPGTNKTRKLGISNFEDKIVQKAMKDTLEQIYEADFLECSYGYRPGRSQHQALDKLGRTIQRKRINYVVSADIRSFFDTVSHEWMVKFLEHRIADKRVIRHIKKMMKAETILKNGIIKANTEGTAQGSILSPLLSNVYLHYALDLWFEKVYKKTCWGEAHYFRYADDFVACFQNKNEAERFLKEIVPRLAKFELQIEESKTELIKFGRYAKESTTDKKTKPKTFYFLGFTHYCSKTRHGAFKLKRRTSGKKFRSKLKELNVWLKRSRSWMKTKDILTRSVQIVKGYLNYYAITDNVPRCANFVYQFRKLLYKWLNRQSQKRSYTWESFHQVLIWVGWPPIRRKVNLCPFSKT